MPGGYAHLFDQDFSDLDAAVKSWQKLAGKLSKAQSNSGRKVSGPLRKAGWTGDSAHYGFAALEAAESMLDTAHTNVQLISTILDTASERMQSAKRALRRATNDAESAGHKVTADGTVERITA
ncbi:MAG: hypothetical protein ACRDP3_28280 [Streptomyces sp.]|uniref:hypothetical protein n=1 Tax=Streptomyces sp. TaxID=1931 RepID=UPI003D6B4CAC